MDEVKWVAGFQPRDPDHRLPPGSQEVPAGEMPMTAKEYRRTLKALNLNISITAPKVLAISPRTSKRFASPEGSIPGPVERLLQMFKRHGIPKEWQ